MAMVTEFQRGMVAGLALALHEVSMYSSTLVDPKDDPVASAHSEGYNSAVRSLALGLANIIQRETR